MRGGAEKYPSAAYNDIALAERVMGMDHRNREQQVWQRVLAGQQEQSDLKTLIFWAGEDVAACRSLTRRLKGKAGEQAQELLEGALKKRDILSGVAVLIGEPLGKPMALPEPREPEKRLVDRCYGRAVRSAQAFTSRMADPRFGSVFRYLALQEEARCAALAALAGALQEAFRR